jgi:hypothetical protein
LTRVRGNLNVVLICISLMAEPFHSEVPPLHPQERKEGLLKCFLSISSTV